MSELKLCRICLRTEAKVYNYEEFQLKSYYEEVLALKMSEVDELPHYFCFECATLLHKFHKFKEKCYLGQKVLKEMLRKGPAGIKELLKFSSKTTLQESEVENPFLETEINTELPVLNHELINTDPVEIDSFFMNSLNVVIEDASVIENDPLSKICDETPNKSHSFQDLTIEPNSDLSQNTNIDMNIEKLTDNIQLPMDIFDLPTVNETLLESDLGYEEINPNLTDNLEGLDENESSILYGDLPSISQAFDESNIGFIDSTLDLSTNNNIDLNIISDLPNTSQESVREYNIETGLDLTKNNKTDNVERVIKDSTGNYHEPESCFINKKVRITSKNQVAPNIHSVSNTTQEYFETVPIPDIDSDDPEYSSNQLQVEQASIERPVKKKRIRNRRKYPFSKKVQPSPCHKKCGNACSTKLTEEDRLFIHELYWKMDKTEQQDWLLQCIRPKRIRRRQGTTLLKNITYDYYITHKGKDIKVCQQFLMKTLDVSQMRFRYAITKHIMNEDYDMDISLCSQES